MDYCALGSVRDLIETCDKVLLEDHIKFSTTLCPCSSNVCIVSVVCFAVHGCLFLVVFVVLVVCVVVAATKPCSLQRNVDGSDVSTRNEHNTPRCQSREHPS